MHAQYCNSREILSPTASTTPGQQVRTGRFLLKLLHHCRVFGATGLHGGGERGQCRSVAKAVQMSGTAAVGSAEAKRRQRTAQFPGQNRRPQAFATHRIVAEPDRFERSVLPQIIDVPVRLVSQPAVMGQPGLHPTRPEGAADIDHPTRFQRQPVAPANGHDVRHGAA